MAERLPQPTPSSWGFEGAEPGIDSVGGYVVRLTLAPESAEAFGRLTAESIGSILELRIDGEVVAAPVVREPILGRSVQIGGAYEAAGVQELAERLRSGDVVVEAELRQ